MLVGIRGNRILRLPASLPTRYDALRHSNDHAVLEVDTVSLPVAGNVAIPEPLPYQRELLAFVQEHERELWDWFASNRVRREHAENVRLELLKSTYRLDRATHESLYGIADQVLRRLGVTAPITLYQAQAVFGPNASLAYIPQEVHIVFYGNAQELLAETELKAVFGHELGHFLLLEGWDGNYMVLGEMLTAMSNDANAGVAHMESARLFGLYTEIFCDRLARDVTEDLNASVSSLVKLQTGLMNVSAEHYLQQAEEILSAGKVRTEGLQHPEAFIRVRALQLYQEKDERLDRAVAELIEGEPALTRLDLLAQQRISARTRQLVDGIFAEQWMRSDAALAHARLFFDGYEPPPDGIGAGPQTEELSASESSLRDYYCYILLDFVAIDGERTEPALAWAIEMAERLGLQERLCELAAKELRIGKKTLQMILNTRRDLISAARTEFADDSEGAA
jgi:hypothetical protein